MNGSTSDPSCRDNEWQTRVRILPAPKGFPTQVFGDGPHCRGGEMANLPARKSKHQAFTHRETRGRGEAQRRINLRRRVIFGRSETEIR